MRSSRSAIMAVAVAAVLIAGCASTIGGTAEPNAAAVSAANSSSPGTSGPGTSDPSSPGITTPSESPTSESSPVQTTGTTPTEDTASTASTESSAPQSSGGSAPTTYPTTPLQYNKTSSTQRGANLLEARRIAGALVVPTFIDASYTRNGDLSTLPYGGPSAMSTLFGSAPMPAVAQRSGMITGFSSARSDPANNGLVVAAFEFGTAAQATAAVPAFAAASADKTTDKGKAVVAGYPASAGWYGTLSGGGMYFQSFLAQGRMVIYTYMSGKKFTGAAIGAALAAKAFAAVTASMRTFVPTAPAAIMALPVDPDGLLAHTLPNTGDNATVFDGSISAAGQLHYDNDPAGTKQIFATAGVDLVADGRASVYRAASTTGADLVRDDFVAYVQKTQTGMQPFALTATVPSAKCLQQALNSVYYCVGTQGRYAFEISAKSESDLNAAMSAQYQLLAGF
ncbi:hypothetical protein ABIB25_001804 [Nakamurella sp. UYEF19]|uniref:DUF7373 family lipoprotein n=1 Tax=Nakamurella sp. UYEF19 TaxID=1756392 RepID=UPI003395116F